MPEFAYNTAKSEPTVLFRFEANYRILAKQSYELCNKTPYINPASKLLNNVWKGI